jgi:tryptophan 2,3-dioxygenase
MSLTYGDYLKIEELLKLQEPRSEGPEHDEMLFIVIHQVYELWFKQVLHEMTYLADLFREHKNEHPKTPAIRNTLRRVLTILKTMVAQVDILETMTPISFNSFRTRLDEASGFQSVQFRELEFILGNRNRAMIHHHRENPTAVARLEQRMKEPSTYQLFLGYLKQNGYPIPEEALADLGDGPPPEMEEIQEILVRVYHHDDGIAQVCELLVDLDEGLQEWRYRHVKMVERTIGTKVGTGGSPGAAYLKSTLFKPVFPDLWNIRSAL